MLDVSWDTVDGLIDRGGCFSDHCNHVVLQLQKLDDDRYRNLQCLHVNVAVWVERQQIATLVRTSGTER